MKKLLVLFLVVSSTISVAQESVLLRLKYKKGDVYALTMKQSMDSPAMAMGTNIAMEMSILNVESNVYTTQTKISKMTMDMMQGGMQMSFDSTKKDDELDDMGKMMKAQISPMLKIVTTTKIDGLGKTLESKVEPNIPNANQFKSTSVPFPKEAVKIGDTWNDKKNIQGMETSSEYKVTKITNKSVILTITSKISGAGAGTAIGTVEIDKKSGVPIKSSVKTNINAGGQEMKVNVETTMTKK